MPRKMKESGVEWLGQIPEGWGVNLVFQVADQVKSKNEGLREQNLLSLSYGKIKRKSIETVGGLLPQSFDGYNIIEADDIVLRLTDLQNDQHSLRVGISSERGIITSAYTTLRPRTRETARYLYYSLHTFDLVKGFYGMGSGVRQGLNYDEVKLIKLPRPSAAEQQQIAAFLDERSAKIDGMIAEAKASIEDYKKWKQSIIFEAVTGKHEKNLKPSGIDWIGDVPEGWRMEVVKHLFSIVRGRVIAATEVKGDGYPVYSSQTKNNGVMGYLDTYDFERDQLTWTTDGANAGAVFLRTGKYSCTNVCGMLSPKSADVNLSFVCYALGYVAFYNRRADINGYKIMSNEMAEIRFPYPPAIDQRRIAAELDEKCAAIDKLVGEKEALIADLEAYKRSLIFETVTGKREVA